MLPETEQIKHHITANLDRKKREVMLANFLGGLSWGFGTVVGATVVVALLIWILSWVNFVPIIGSFVNDILDVISKNQKLR